MSEQLELSGAPPGVGTGNAGPLPSALPTYDRIKAINWSSLKHMHVSPLLYRRRLETPAEETADFIIGRAIHCLTLEPGRFAELFAEYDGVRRGKEWTAWCSENPRTQALKPNEMERVKRSADALLRHRIAGPLIRSCRYEEVTTWTDPETGLACKGRLDGISPVTVIDLKKSGSATLKKFLRSAEDYLYHGQLAFYRDGAVCAKKIDGTSPPWMIGVQDDEPYDVWPMELPEETLTAGRTLYRGLLRHLAMCIEADMWPGEVPDGAPWLLSKWAAGQSEDLSAEDF